MLFRKVVGETLVGTFVQDQAYSNTLLYVMKTVAPHYELHYILALLNSTLIGAYFRAAYAISQEDIFPQIMLDDMSLLPIRRIEFTTPAHERVRLVKGGIAEIAEWIEAAKVAAAPSASFSAFSGSNFGRWLDARLSAQPEQADVIHNLLAYLAEQMMEMNKQKPATTADFWLDLEGVTDTANFETLRNKGKHERTLWKRAPACRPFVSQESHATRRLDESLSWNEDAFKAFVKVLAGKVQNLTDVVAVYRKYHPAYRDLVTRWAVRGNRWHFHNRRNGK